MPSSRRSPTDWIADRAKERGPIAPGSFRVVVIESDASVSSRDFSSRDAASTYADDAAIETDDASPLAYVLDASFAIVHRGSAPQTVSKAARRAIACPFCGQEDVVSVDTGGGSHQSYVEDCAVCCRPRVVHVEPSDDPAEPIVWLERGQ